jgi:hypothetical protein
MSDDELIRIAVVPGTLSLYWVENVAILAWHQPITAAAMEAMYALVEPQRERYPTGMSFVHIGRGQHAMVDAEARAVIVRILRELDHYTAAVAIVARASGFWASTLRSVATGITVVARSKVEVRFHEEVEEVVEWLPSKHEQMTGVMLDRDQLLRVLRAAGEDARGDSR